MTERDIESEAPGATQLSAMFDGQLPAGECGLLSRRLARDPQLRQQWANYALIGACLRGESVPARNLVAVVAKAVEAEPAFDSTIDIARPGAGSAAVRLSGEQTAPRRWMKPLAGLSVAAGVAAVAILSLRPDAPVAPGSQPMFAAVEAPAAEVVLGAALGTAFRAEPVSYVVPPDTEPTPASLASAQLANYVVAHSSVSAPLSRRSLLSAFVAADAVVIADASGSSVPDAAAAGIR